MDEKNAWGTHSSWQFLKSKNETMVVQALFSLSTCVAKWRQESRALVVHSQFKGNLVYTRLSRQNFPSVEMLGVHCQDKLSVSPEFPSGAVPNSRHQFSLRTQLSHKHDSSKAAAKFYSCELLKMTIYTSVK